MKLIPHFPFCVERLCVRDDGRLSLRNRIGGLCLRPCCWLVGIGGLLLGQRSIRGEWWRLGFAIGLLVLMPCLDHLQLLDLQQHKFCVAIHVPDDRG